MGRQRCVSCERPLSVCLCSQLPLPPLQTRTCVIVLQHPHEARHKLSTLPILAKCLANCHVFQGRRFQAGCSPLLDFFFTHNPPDLHALLLFPMPSAQPISDWFSHHQLQDFSASPVDIQKVGTLNHLHGHQYLSSIPVAGTYTCITENSILHSHQTAGHADLHHSICVDDMRAPPFLLQQEDTTSLLRRDGNACPNICGFPKIVLIAVDGTWQHANEMVRASASYLNKFALPVCLPFNTDQEGLGMPNSELIIRKEPFKGCMTTLEAVSSCLKVLEPNGVEIHDKLTSVLRSMVHFQASKITSHKVRTRQPRKGGNQAFHQGPLG